MKRFLLSLFAVLILAGCHEKPTQPSATPEANLATLAVPMPTSEILAALGPENDLPIQRLLSNPLFVAAGKPKQFLTSPVSTGNELFVADFIRQYFIIRSLQPYFDPNTIEQFVLSTGFPMLFPVSIPNPQDPNMPPQQTVISIIPQATMITFDQPVDAPELLTSILGNVEPGILESLKRTEGKNEYYDLTRPDIAIPLRIAVGVIGERTVVLAEGTENDIKSVFSDAAPRNAVLERLKHTPVGTADFTFMTSLEGFTPEMLEQLQNEMRQIGVIPPIFIPVIKQHLRAVSLSLNISAAKGQPVLSMSMEGRDEKGAEAIGETMGGLILVWQTTLATMSDDAKQTLPIPPDFAAALLESMPVEVKGTQVHVVLNNFDALIPAIAGGIHTQQTVALQELQLERLVWLVERCLVYYMEHKKFPADILDEEGKPLLSWRVALLPAMGMADLYNKFKLDEPWDSEANEALLEEMPAVFQQLTIDSEPDPAKTVVRFFDSAGTPFSKRDLTIEDIKFPQTTLMFVNVTPQYAVEWTKPEPLEFNIDGVMDILGNPLLGVAFSGQKYVWHILPDTDPNYERRKQEVEMLIYGAPLTDLFEPLSEEQSEPQADDE